MIDHHNKRDALVVRFKKDEQSICTPKRGLSFFLRMANAPKRSSVFFKNKNKGRCTTAATSQATATNWVALQWTSSCRHQSYSAMDPSPLHQISPENKHDPSPDPTPFDPFCRSAAPALCRLPTPTPFARRNQQLISPRIKWEQ